VLVQLVLQLHEQPDHLCTLGHRPSVSIEQTAFTGHPLRRANCGLAGS
jgi:hypothetical protein